MLLKGNGCFIKFGEGFYIIHNTPDEVFKAEFLRRYGKAGANLLEASSLAGTVPLRLASSFDFTWDFSLYSEGFMALDNTVKRVDYISIDRHH